MLQLNISLFLFVVLILGSLVTSSHTDNIYIIDVCIFIAVLSALAIIFIVSRFYYLQNARPLDGQNASVAIRDRQGNSVTVNNPPDSFFDKGQASAAMRLLLTGYDSNLCPTGQIIGKASEGKYRKLTAEEKAEFIKQHHAEIRDKKLKIRTNLEPELNLLDQIAISEAESSTADQNTECEGEFPQSEDGKTRNVAG